MASTSTQHSHNIMGHSEDVMYLPRCSPHKSWGRSNQEVQQSPLALERQADLAVPGSQDGRKNPGCRDGPDLGHLEKEGGSEGGVFRG